MTRVGHVPTADVSAPTHAHPREHPSLLQISGETSGWNWALLPAHPIQGHTMSPVTRSAFPHLSGDGCHYKQYTPKITFFFSFFFPPTKFIKARLPWQVTSLGFVSLVADTVSITGTVHGDTHTPWQPPCDAILSNNLCFSLFFFCYFNKQPVHHHQPCRACHIWGIWF